MVGESLSTEYGQAKAPWWGVPADNKWFARLMISDLIAVQLEKLDIAPPKVSTEAIGEMLTLREQLLKD
jgi:hypothetical protein